MKIRTDRRSDVIPADATSTLPELFRIRVRRTPDKEKGLTFSRKPLF